MKTDAMKHQDLFLQKSDCKRYFAVLAEQGTGKSWMTLADAERCFEQDKIDALLVIAPNNVHIGWVTREAEKHLSCKWKGAAWRGTGSKRFKLEYDAVTATHYTPNNRPLRILSMSIDSVNTTAGIAVISDFLKRYRVMMVVDESNDIKNPTAKRSQTVCEMGKLATARRILTGTPLTRSPQDLFMQFHFLKPGLIGTKSYRAFTSEYCELLTMDDPEMYGIMRRSKAKNMPQVVKKDKDGMPRYKNLDKLSAIIAGYSFRVTKDVLDLPPKVYKEIPFQLSKKAMKAYQLIEQEWLYEFNNGEFWESVEFEHARIKLRQVVRGYVMAEGNLHIVDEKENAAINAMRGILESIMDEDPDHKVLIWAVFKEEVRSIHEAVTAMGLNYGVYNGDTSTEERERLVDAFQRGELDGLVLGLQAAATGITLTKAKRVIYYSHSDDARLRMQSEDRNHRIGTDDTVVYYDLIAEGTIDEIITKRNKLKVAVAEQVLGAIEHVK